MDTAIHQEALNGLSVAIGSTYRRLMLVITTLPPATLTVTVALPPG
ncbi:hypothetical protein BN381_470019 [Candidatus Microthrix parvicella RN1]|uniref:Uncharacterized protein n=1 Tax=Candidatus Neomicrothrix parvicella RN1 TaxID=1229780 RepID=R4Z1Q1_9ACTN|nr:hypothetical protein BN381_470019 [Candidatus Microthrix parvicella RN1]